jgi:hypothetical protein
VTPIAAFVIVVMTTAAENYAVVDAFNEFTRTRQGRYAGVGELQRLNRDYVMVDKTLLGEMPARVA